MTNTQKPAPDGSAPAQDVQESPEVEYLEGDDWEEGVVYVDEDGNEFMVEFVDEDDAPAGYDDDDYDDDDDIGHAYVEDDEDFEDDEEAEEDGNPLAYDKVQEATDGINEIYRTGAGTAREFAEVGRELKEAADDIKKMFDFKDLFKL